MPFWLTGLIGLFVAAVLADRVAALVATRRVGARLSGLVDVVRRLQVTPRGVPFLTQALRGRYRRVHVSGEGVAIGPITEGRLRGVLYGARAPLRAALAGTVSSVPVARIEVSVVLPYAQLPRLARIDGLVVEPDGDHLAVRAPLPVPGVGELVRVSARGRLLLADGTVRLAVSGLRVAGLALPGVVVSQLSRVLSAGFVVPPLPYGLDITDVRVRAGGLVVQCAADDVVLRGRKDPEPVATG